MSRERKVKDQQLERDVAARAKTVLQTGLPLRPTRVDIRALQRKLEEIAAPGSVAGRLYDVFERSSQHGAPIDKLACRKGCAYCCHGMVAITAPEAFALAQRVRSGGSEAVARFKERAVPVAGKTAAERFGAKLPCPLLGAEGACTVYDVRPIACRRVVSYAIDPCLEEFEGLDGEIEVPGHYNRHAANALVALALAFDASGRPFAHYELSSAILAVLDAPDAETRWRRGENVFAGLRTEEAGDDVSIMAATVRG